MKTLEQKFEQAKRLTELLVKKTCLQSDRYFSKQIINFIKITIMSELKIKTIEKGCGESSIYFQANDQPSMPNRVDEIKEESKHIGVGEYGDLIITVYRGYIDEKMVFEIAANNDITLSFF